MMLAGLNEDLTFPLMLPRPAVPNHQETLAGITDKVVLVTGAGGSIGSELCLQIAGYRPKTLIMADNSELALYEIDSTIRQGAPQLPTLAAIVDVRDKEVVRKLFRDYEIDTVFHAAALKHVPLMENDHNVAEAVKTNVGGTINVADACYHFGSTMVLVSTDKAVNPLSVMGMTKRLAEIYVRAKANEHKAGNYAQVRFGNVIGSSGSVIPLFRRQIAQGGPVTVTDKEMTRYMMSIKEAVLLTIQAGSMQSQPTDQYGLFILDMGEPVRIEDIAKQLIQLSGQNVEITYTGLRVGEKLSEELHYPWEQLTPTDIPRVLRGVTPYGTPPVMLYELRKLVVHIAERKTDEVRRLLRELVSVSIGNQW